MSEYEGDGPERSIWIRLLYMVLFALIFGVTETIMYLTALASLVFRLFGAAVPTELLSFGRSLARYLRQVVLFLTFNTELLPFPFSAWPSDHGGEDDHDQHGAAHHT